MPRRQRQRRDPAHAQRTMCRAFAEGTCPRGDACTFSHTLLDPARLLRLVPPPPRQAAPESRPGATRSLVLEFRVRRDADGAVLPGAGEWTASVYGVAHLALDSTVYAVPARPKYPRRVFASALEAVKDLEESIFGCVAPVPWKVGEPQATVCTAIAEGSYDSAAGCACRHNHALVDFTTVERMLGEWAARPVRPLRSPTFFTYTAPENGPGELYWAVMQLNSDMLQDYVTTAPDLAGLERSLVRYMTLILERTPAGQTT